MKTKAFIIACLLGALNLKAQTFEWAKSFGGSNNDVGTSIAVDATGNVYTTGYFQGTVDFDPGPGTFMLTAAGYDDVFIQKLDASGNFLWARSFGSSAYEDKGYSIGIDATGNVYTTGYFQGTVDFDPGAGTFTRSSDGASRTSFIHKMNPNGNFVWVRTFQGVALAVTSCVKLDAFGNLYTVGRFQGLVDFDPGAGFANFNSLNGTLDVFVHKMDTAGNFKWVRVFGGSSDDQGNSIDVHGGHIYTTGYFWGTANFDPGVGSATFTSAGYDDVFIQKMDTSGNFVWAKKFGGIDTDYGYSVAIDHTGSAVYTTGLFRQTVDFDPGAGVDNHSSIGNTDIFVHKLDTAGNFIWAKTFGSTSDDVGNSITADLLGNIYTSGGFRLTADFDPGTGTANFTSIGNNDVFIQKMDASGNFLWAGTFGEASEDFAFLTRLDGAGNIYTTGQFAGTVDFDPGSGTTNLTSVNNYDTYVQKISSIPLPIKLLDFDVKPVKEFVEISWTTASETNNAYFTIERSKNGGHWEMVKTIEGSGNSNHTIKYQATDYKPFAGTSFYRIKQTDFDGKHSYSSIRAVSFDEMAVTVNFYPNPTSKTVRVTFDREARNVELSLKDVNGRVISTKQVDFVSSTEIDITSPPGIYFLTIKTSGKQKVVKLMKH